MVACDSLHGGTTKGERRGDTGSIRLLLVGETDIGTGSLHGLGDSEDSRADGMRRECLQSTGGTSNLIPI